MKRFYLLSLIFSLIVLLSACDAFVSIPYSVKNKSGETLRLYVPAQARSRGFESKADTFLSVAPNTSVIVAYSMSFVTSPVRAARQVYHKQPGLCGLKLTKGESALLLPCGAPDWKYQRGGSVLILKQGLP